MKMAKLLFAINTAFSNCSLIDSIKLSTLALGPLAKHQTFKLSISRIKFLRSCLEILKNPSALMKSREIINSRQLMFHQIIVITKFLLC